MSLISSKLKELVNYFNVNRAVGHTTRMLNGAAPVSFKRFDACAVNNRAKPGAIVLTQNSDMAIDLNKRMQYYGKISEDVRAYCFTNNNYNSILKGHSSPLLFDNALLHNLFNEAVDEIDKLESMNKRYKELNLELIETIEKLKVKELDAEDAKLCPEKESPLRDCPTEPSPATRPYNSIIQSLKNEFESEYKNIKTVDIKIEYK